MIFLNSVEGKEKNIKISKERFKQLREICSGMRQNLDFGRDENGDLLSELDKDMIFLNDQESRTKIMYLLENQGKKIPEGIEKKLDLIIKNDLFRRNKISQEDIWTSLEYAKHLYYEKGIGEGDEEFNLALEETKYQPIGHILKQFLKYGILLPKINKLAPN